MGEENDKEKQSSVLPLSDRSAKWISSGTGGLVGAVCTVLFIVIPVIQTWLANTKEIQISQIKNNADQIAYITKTTAEQIAYITKRMEDSDKERDLYKKEMLECQKEMRSLKKL